MPTETRTIAEDATSIVTSPTRHAESTKLPGDEVTAETVIKFVNKTSMESFTLGVTGRAVPRAPAIPTEIFFPALDPQLESGPAQDLKAIVRMAAVAAARTAAVAAAAVAAT